MQLKMEIWAEKNLRENALELFNEAAICYKVGAYRSALLMSYLSFKQTIRERIINSEKPEEISAGQWENEIQKSVKNDDKWEEKVNELVESTKTIKGENGIFKFTNRERLLNRYVYWKNVRNSCAHAKSEHISSATVEQFWNYMKDDLPEYYILGGEAYLLNELQQCYRYYSTIGKEKIEKILKDIATVYKSNVKNCFQNFDKELDFSVNESNFDFWKIIIDNDDPTIIDGFVDCIFEHEEKFTSFYHTFPKLFEMMISRHKEFIQKYLAPIMEKGCYIDGGDDVFCGLLVKILEENNKLLDLKAVTSNRRTFSIIAQYGWDNDQLETLNHNKIFKQYLFNAGSSFFENDSLSQWDYYGPYGEIIDDDVKNCFRMTEWDMELVTRLDDSYAFLVNSLPLRTNGDSIRNGERRKRAYEEIVRENADKINSAILAEGREVSEFVNIKEIIL